jgi:hypothetical protein
MADYRYVVVLLSDSEAIASLMGAIARCNASIVASCANDLLTPEESPPPDWQISFSIKFCVMDDLALFDQLFSTIARDGVIERLDDGYGWIGEGSNVEN